MTVSPTPNSPPSMGDAVAAALDWWRDAGVTFDYSDEPAGWLAEPEAPTEKMRAAAQPSPQTSATAAPEQAKPALPRLGGSPESWPQTLDAFAPWWLEAENLDEGGIYPRVPPRGPKEATLMVIVGEPGAEDTERLLTGPEGKLLQSFLHAAGLAENQVYVASALPRHTPLADWDALSAAGLGQILLHHIVLAAPKHIITFGRNILPLFGHELAQEGANLREINHDGFSVPVTPSKSLAALLRSPAMRKAFWQCWLEHTDG